MLTCPFSILVQCIGEAFSVDPNSAEQREQLLPGRKVPLEQVWGVFTKTNSQQQSQSTTSSDSTAVSSFQFAEFILHFLNIYYEQSTSTTEQKKEVSPEKQEGAPSEEAKKEAEALKAEGNRLISAKEFDNAVEKYTEAIAKDPSNPVYYSNRCVFSLFVHLFQ